MPNIVKLITTSAAALVTIYRVLIVKCKINVSDFIYFEDRLLKEIIFIFA
jgi:hypothetical protein